MVRKNLDTDLDVNVAHAPDSVACQVDNTYNTELNNSLTCSKIDFNDTFSEIIIPAIRQTTNCTCSFILLL